MLKRKQLKSRRTRLFLLLLSAVSLVLGTRLQAQQPAPSLLLYAIDCGRLDYTDMNGFADTEDYSGQTGSLVVPCFLVRHGADWLLWDTGVGDRIASLPNGEMKQGARFTLKRTLASQLAEIGVKPDEIKYVGLSHLHADHSGDIGLFLHATFLIAAAELPWARTLPTPEGVEASLIAPLDHAEIKTFAKDLDVFGDGTVRILSAPGHTPGHCMLLVRLAKSGPVLITGDLLHQSRSRKGPLVPRVNVSRADTLASIDRFEGLVKATGARVIIPHERRDFEALPKFPGFIE